MGAIVDTLGLNWTYFLQFGIFIFSFFFLKRFFFLPFLKLFEARHQKTVEDRKAAESLSAEAEAKLKEYQAKLGEARAAAKKQYETLLSEAKSEEARIISEAREEIKKITQEATGQVSQAREKLRADLKSEVDQLANSVSERLLAK